MGTKNFSNANDLITFSRSSAGTALRPISYGDELVTNGTFDTDTSGWTPVINDGDFSVIDGVARLTKGSTNPSVYQNITTNIGSVYVASLEFTGRDGADLQFSATTSSVSSSFFSTTGLVNLVFVATSSVEEMEIQLGFAVTGEWIEFDNVSVKEVLFDQGTLTLFNHPAGIPRIEYDADGNVLGLLVEESRTNLLTYSEDFTDASWAKVGLTSTTKDQAGPDGVLSGYTLLANTSSLSYVSLGFTVSTSTQYTVSVFAKAGTEDWIALNIRNNTTVSDGVRYFDVASGALGVAAGSTLDGASIEDVGNGWYRCSVTFTSDAADTTASLRIYVAEGNGDAITNDGTESVIIYGAQLEAGAFPTSYIPTAGATATRSADFASIPVADFGYNDEAGTFVAEFGYVDPSNVDTNYLLSGGSLARFFYNNTATSAWSIYSGSGISVSGISSDGSSNKAGIAMDDSGTTAYVDGGFAVSNATVKPQGNVSYDFIAIGGVSAATRLNGHIKSINYYPRRLTDAQLEALTAPRSSETLFLTFDGLESSFTEKSIHG